MSTIFGQRAGAAALFGKGQLAVLGLLFCNSGREYYTREVIRAAHGGQGAVQRVLDRLSRAGLIIRRKSGRQVYYQANRKAALFNEIRSLMLKSAGMADLLRAALEPAWRRIRFAFVYGLFAKGAETADSDIDLCLIGSVSLQQTAGLLRPVQDRLALNHDGNQGYCSGSSRFTDETAKPAGKQVVSTDRYGYIESQESVGISAEMFDEFLTPHFSRFANKFKMFKYGCCEPVHDFITVLQRLHGLRKVSVTPWCDMPKLTQRCRKDVIWCRKPIPLKLCGDTFDPADLKAHLQETLDIGKDFFVEFVFRDTNMLTGKMQDRLDATCAMIRKMTGHPEGSRGKTGKTPNIEPLSTPLKVQTFDYVQGPGHRISNVEGKSRTPDKSISP
ncbi:MAG: hypothetical protein ABIF71_11010 [Planctomycetota bacterium]